MPVFRSGTWVKFKDPILDNQIPGAFVTGDGYHLGIYLRGEVDSTGELSKDRIMVCDPKGRNIPTLTEEGGVVNLSIDPSEAVELHLCTKLCHLPEARLATTNVEAFQESHGSHDPDLHKLTNQAG